jgi:hypothetical protein
MEEPAEKQARKCLLLPNFSDHPLDFAFRRREQLFKSRLFREASGPCVASRRVPDPLFSLGMSTPPAQIHQTLRVVEFNP